MRENKGTTNSKMAVCARACVHDWCARSSGALGHRASALLGVRWRAWHGTSKRSCRVNAPNSPERHHLCGRHAIIYQRHCGRCKTCAFPISSARALPSTKLSRAPGRANLTLHRTGRSRAARRSNHRAPSRSNSSTPSCSQMSRRSSRAESTAINPRHGVGDGPPQTSRIKTRNQCCRTVTSLALLVRRRRRWSAPE